MSRDDAYSRGALDRKSPEELESEIERTRARISEEVDALSYRLSPAGVSEGAKGALRETQDATFKAIEEVADSLLERSDQLGVDAVAFIKRNAVPATLLGLGFTWLLMRSQGAPRRR